MRHNEKLLDFAMRFKFGGERGGAKIDLSIITAL
jgi:hypothetical protein